MPRNIEIKAKLPNRDRVIDIAENISGSPVKVLHQEDVFFPCEAGRLKLRILSPSNGELIHYQRANEKGPKTSKYLITRTEEPTKLREIMEDAFGVRAVVKKTRLLYLYGRTRIHIDSVENLGEFIELEAVLKESEDESQGKKDVDSLIKDLGINESDLVREAYVDLLERKNEEEKKRLSR